MRLSFHDSATVDQFFRQYKIDPHVLKRMRYLCYHEGRAVERLLQEVPGQHRAAFADTFTWQQLQLVQRYDSQCDGSTKLVLETPDGLRLETVIMRARQSRVSVCVSSQVGCAARCTFCATGYMSVRRSLSEAHIIEQIVQARAIVQQEGRTLRNVVFMGMGEPLHNATVVGRVLETLQSPRCFGLSPQRVLVSTVGIPQQMVQFAARFPQTGLALSLHAARQSLREQLIPLARKYPLPQLKAALQQVAALQRRPMMIEYLMLEDINDRDDDADLLAEFLHGLRVHVNLIPFNPIAEAPAHFRPTDRERRNAFANRLRQRGHLVTIRYSLGADIAAACGQLAQPVSPLDTLAAHQA